MPINTGSKKAKLFLGSQKVSRAFLGDAKIYSAGSVVTYHVDEGVVYREEVEEGKSCLEPKGFVPAKEGFLFAGWAAEPDGAVLDSMVMGEDAMALYAVYLPSELQIDTASPSDYIRLDGAWTKDPDTGKNCLAAWASRNSAPAKSGTICIHYGPYKKARLHFSLPSFNMNVWYDTTPPTNDGNIRINDMLVYYTFRQSPYLSDSSTYELTTSQSEVPCSVYAHTGDQDSFCWIKCVLTKVTLTM